MSLTDAMIEGLKLAGRNPTRATFISNLRAVTDYTIGGLSTTPVDFNYLTGNLPPQQCANFVQLQGGIRPCASRRVGDLWDESRLQRMTSAASSPDV